MIKLCYLVCALLLGTITNAAENPCYSVKLENTEIVCFSQGVGSISAGNRSHLVEQKIKNLAEDYAFDADKISVVESDNSYLIVANDIPLMSLSVKDLKDVRGDNKKVSLIDYANQVNEKVKVSIAEYRQSRTPDAIYKGVLYTAIATILLFLGFYFLSRISFYLKNKLLFLAEKYSGSLAFKSYKIISPYRIRQIITGFSWFVKILVIAVLFYFYVPLELSFFPWTAKYSAQIISFVASPFKEIIHVIFNYLPNIFYIIAIAFITHYFLKLVKIFFSEVEMGNIQFSSFHKDWAQPTYKLVQFLFYALALVMMFPYLPGSSSPAFQGMSVFFGVLISFGSGSSIANIISGVVITYMRPFKLGDRVKIADTIGDVTEKNFLVTRIKTIKNVNITIPNSMVLGSHIINYSSSADHEGLILNTTVTIGYDAPWKTVHELLKKAAYNTELIDKDKEPFILQTALNDFYVSYELNAYTRYVNSMAKIYSDLHQNIQDSFNEGGIEIMSPHYGALRDGNEVTIPVSHRKSNYSAPEFKISIKSKNASY